MSYLQNSHGTKSNKRALALPGLLLKFLTQRPELTRNQKVEGSADTQASCLPEHRAEWRKDLKGKWRISIHKSILNDYRTAKHSKFYQPVSPKSSGLHGDCLQIIHRHRRDPTVLDQVEGEKKKKILRVILGNFWHLCISKSKQMSLFSTKQSHSLCSKGTYSIPSLSHLSCCIVTSCLCFSLIRL